MKQSAELQVARFLIIFNLVSDCFGKYALQYIQDFQNFRLSGPRYFYDDWIVV